MRTELRLFFKWGIEFEEGYVAEQHAARAVSYADRLTLEQEILRRRTVTWKNLRNRQCRQELL